MKSSQNTLFRLQGERFDGMVLDTVSRIHKNGKIWFVDSNTGSDTRGGNRLSSPFATLSAAMSACTASQGDMIIVLPQHAETITSTITVKAGVRIVGLTVGNLRPVITINGATDLFNMSGANSLISGLELTIATTDAATALINVAAAKCKISNVKMVPSATSVNVVDCITLASGANDVVIDNVEIYNTTVPVNSFLSIEAAIARMVMTNCHFSGDCDTAGIIDSAAATNINWYNNRVRTVGTTIPALTLDSNPTGVVDLFFAYGTHGTLATNANWGNALRLSRIYTLEETNGSVQATNIVPALDTD